MTARGDVVEQMSPRMRELYREQRNAVRRGDRITEPMREAYNAYLTLYREQHPEKVKADTVRKAARDNALRALARRFPAEFAELFRAELCARGLE